MQYHQLQEPVIKKISFLRKRRKKINLKEFEYLKKLLVF